MARAHKAASRGDEYDDLVKIKQNTERRIWTSLRQNTLTQYDGRIHQYWEDASLLEPDRSDNSYVVQYQSFSLVEQNT